MWLFFYVIWPVLAGELATIIVPPDPRYAALGLQTPGTVVLEQILARLSPSTLFGEIVVAILDPTTRALGPIYLSQLQGAVLGAPLPLAASVLIAWPQIVGLDRDDDHLVRHRLRDIPAPGSARIDRRGRIARPRQSLNPLQSQLVRQTATTATMCMSFGLTTTNSSS